MPTVRSGLFKLKLFLFMSTDGIIPATIWYFPSGMHWLARTVARDIISSSVYNTRVKSTRWAPIGPNESPVTEHDLLRNGHPRPRNTRGTCACPMPHLYPVLIGHGEVFKGLLNAVSKRVKNDARPTGREHLWLLRLSINFLGTRENASSTLKWCSLTRQFASELR